MHLEFNNRARSYAFERGYGYADINGYLAAKGDTGLALSPTQIDIAHLPVKRDHHVIPSLAMYRAHYLAAGRAFGLDI